MIKLPPDITFVIQLVSFLVFWQLMRALVFAPAQKALAQRRQRTEGALAEAETLRAEAETLNAQRQAALEAARSEGMREAEEIRRRAEAEEQAILAGHQTAAQALLDRERAATTVQIEAAYGPLRAEAQDLAAAIVVKVLGRAA